MHDVYAWVDEQRETNQREFNRLLAQGRQLWTPTQIFNTCCVKWLVDGNDRGYDPWGGRDEYSPRNGCDGRRCNRAHPCIRLSFDTANKQTVATMSHRLDPFVNCLNNLVEEERAWPHSATVYHLNGYLRANETALREYDGFGRHLIKVERGH